MTRTQFIDALRNVRRQIIPWISIVVIGMVALVAYLSLIYGSKAIEQAISGYYNTHRLWDLEVNSTLLMDEDDLDAIRAIPGVERAEPVWAAGAKLLREDKETSVTVQTLSSEISVPELTEGRLPSKPGECAIEQQLQKTLGLGAGDTLQVECSVVAGIDPLKDKEYVVTGVFRHPDHISFELPEAPYLLVTEDSFNTEGLQGAFMKTRIRVAGAPEDRYSDEYIKAVEPVMDAVKAIAPERGAARENAIRRLYEDQISEGQQKLDEAAAKLDEAYAQLDDGTKALEDGKQKLLSARQQLDEGWTELKEAEEKLKSVRQQLEDGGHVLADAEYQIASLEALLYKAESMIGMIDGISGQHVESSLPFGLSDQLEQARDGLKVYAAGRDLWYYTGEEYLDGLTKFEQGKKRLEQGEQEYLQGKAELEKGQADYDNGRAELEKGQKEYDAGAKQLRDAREQMDSIDTCRWLVLNNYGNTGYVFAETQAYGLSSMSYSFSSIFLVIAVLVIYASVGRMVQEQSSLIGASKALGLYNREILAKYMFFGISAALTAAVLGVGITYFVVQKQTLVYYEPFFVIDRIPPCFRPAETIVVVVILPLVTALSVWLACRSLIRIPAVQLLQGIQQTRKRKASRRRSASGLYSRLILRNIGTDLPRVLVTIVSIAGCCLLLVGGFTVKYAIERVNDRQFGQIIRFQAELYFDPAHENAAAELSQILSDNDLPYALVSKSSFVFQTGSTLSSATAIVTEPENLDGFYQLTDPKTKAPVQATQEGVLIPSRISSYWKLHSGDSLTAYDASLATHEIPISGVFKNHFGNLLFFTPACYERVFEAEARPNCFFVRLGGMSLEELEARTGNVAGFQRIADAAADRDHLDRFSSVLDAMILLLLGLAGVMAYFIVMNLSVTYIQKKTKELTIMRINGFTVRECVVYVSWDLIITTVFGIILGLAAGHPLGQMVLSVAEGPYMQFVHEPDLRTYLFSALITAGFSVLISSSSLRRVKYLKLSDVL